jgi:putative sterol carrier protein
LAVFEDAQAVYDTLGRLFAEIAEDDELYARFCTADTVVRYEYSDPDAVITVRLRCGEEGRVDFGESEMEPEVTMRMSADTGHRFWLGDINVTVALARGEITAKGPVAKILKLVPLTKPVFPRYKQQLLDQGRADLAET